MLPGNALSYIPVTGLMYAPDSNRVGPLIDFERGGVAVNDLGQGLQTRNWTFSYTPEGQIVTTPDGGDPVVVISRPGVTELAGTFDQNMAPVVTFVIDGEIFLNWFDSITGQRRTDSFGIGHSPRLTLDDKRDMTTSTSDVIVAYIRNQALYYRQQRDRFGVERLLKDGLSPITRLKNVGMTTQLRLLFELV